MLGEIEGQDAAQVDVPVSDRCDFAQNIVGIIGRRSLELGGIPLRAADEMDEREGAKLICWAHVGRRGGLGQSGALSGFKPNADLLALANASWRWRPFPYCMSDHSPKRRRRVPIRVPCLITGTHTDSNFWPL